MGRRDGYFTAAGIRANPNIVLPVIPVKRCVVMYGKRRHPSDTIVPVYAYKLAQDVGSKHLGADAHVLSGEKLPHDGI